MWRRARGAHLVATEGQVGQEKPPVPLILSDAKQVSSASGDSDQPAFGTPKVRLGVLPLGVGWDCT